MNSPMVSKTESEQQGADCRCELEENVEILRCVQDFSEIPIERLKIYAYLSKRFRYKSGHYLFRQGDRDERGYIIISGRAQIIREYSDHSVLLNELPAGEFFGGLALLSNIKRLFSVRAVTDVECLTLDRDSFQKLLVQFPEMASRVLDTMIRRIVQLEERLLENHIHQCVYG